MFSRSTQLARAKCKDCDNPSTSSASSERTETSTANFTGNGNSDGTFLPFSNLNLEGAWQAFGVSGIRHTAGADSIEIDVQALYAQVTTPSEMNVAPELELLMNGVVIQTSATGLQLHTGDNNTSSNSISITVKDVAPNTTFQLKAQRGNSAVTGAVPITLGTASFKAVIKPE